MPEKSSVDKRKAVLIVLFIPSVERDGKTLIRQTHWVDLALEILGKLFGGATAYPKAKGVWRDDARGGHLVRDEPVVIHCYTSPQDLQEGVKLNTLATSCKQLGRDPHQGEVGLVIGEEYLAIREFSEEVDT